MVIWLHPTLLEHLLEMVIVDFYLPHKIITCRMSNTCIWMFHVVRRAWRIHRIAFDIQLHYIRDHTARCFCSHLWPIFGDLSGCNKICLSLLGGDSTKIGFACTKNLDKYGGLVRTIELVGFKQTMCPRGGIINSHDQFSKNPMSLNWTYWTGWWSGISRSWIVIFP